MKNPKFVAPPEFITEKKVKTYTSSFSNTPFLVNRPEEDKAWVAGLLDGHFECYIFGYNKTFSGRKVRYHTFSFVFITKNPFVAERFRTITGHNIEVVNLKQGVCYKFRIQSKNALNMMRFTRLYSHARKAEIEFILKFLAVNTVATPVEEREYARLKLFDLVLENKTLKRPYDEKVIALWPASLGTQYLLGYTGDTDILDYNSKSKESVDIFANRV